MRDYVPQKTINMITDPCLIRNESLLMHLPLVPHICVIKVGQHWLRQWRAAFSAPSHYLNQCSLIANWTIRNKSRRNSNQNTKLFIHKSASENTVCEMAATLSKGRWVNKRANAASELRSRETTGKGSIAMRCVSCRCGHVIALSTIDSDLRLGEITIKHVGK